MSDLSGHADGPPPSFEDAHGRRQKVRAAGLDPDYWYAVEQSSRLKKGEVLETKFWGRSIAVFRTQDGRVHAVENRCAHRHVELSRGEVVDCRLVCPYHGWSYDGEGNAKISHELYGKKEPRLKIQSFPIKERYGLIFIFPGDPEVAKTHDIPSIPELEGDEPWPHCFVQFDCDSHHSMLLDNVSDFTHGFLHRKFQPFGDHELLRVETVGDRVELEYKSKIAAGRLQDMFIDRREVGCDHMLACYDYPYHWSNTENRIKHFLFTLPKDERSNRHIFIFYVSPSIVRVPGLGLRMPRTWVSKAMQLTQRITLEPLLGQDVWVLAHEQTGWERHWDKPGPEVSPVVNAFQDLTIRKWEEHLARRDLPMPQQRAPKEKDGRRHLGVVGRVQS